jgi:flagellar basal body-associated protein FliL
MILLPPLSSLSVQPLPFLAWRSGIAVALWSIHLICVVHFTYFSCVTETPKRKHKKNKKTLTLLIVSFSFFFQFSASLDSMATTNQTTIEMQENPMSENPVSENPVLSKAEKKEKRRLSQIMMEYDVDNNGEFSKEEVIRIVRDMDFIKVKMKRFKCFATVLVVALVLLVCAMFGVVYLGNEVSKESHTSAKTAF